MHPLFLIALVLLNLNSFVLMGVDKRRARKGNGRMSERTLFLSAACFGALGGVLGMQLFRHKTKHLSFRILFPAMLLLQAGLLAGWYFG